MKEIWFAHLSQQLLHVTLYIVLLAFNMHLSSNSLGSPGMTQILLMIG